MTSASPMFSIITPVKNGARFVSGYVETLLLQVYDDWEAIIVDDYSTDNTLELLLQAVSADGRFLVCGNSAPPVVRGPYQARNEGLKLARGQYICFLDVDDRWSPHKLDAQYRLLQEMPHLLVIYSSYIASGSSLVSGYVQGFSGLVSPKVLVKFANPVPLLTSCVKRGIIGSHGFPAANHEDYLFWHSIISRVSPSCIYCDPRPLACYRLHAGSISANKFRSAVWIWRCYRMLGYSVVFSAFAFLLRGLYQIQLVCNRSRFCDSDAESLWSCEDLTLPMP